MKNSDAYYFIGHLFALNIEESRREEVLRQIESENIDWDKVVKLASDQLVLPLLYVKFRDSDLLDYLPDGLAQHLETVYDLNRKRNEQLIEQAHEIAQCLNGVGIRPIFIKGMANLLDGLYPDNGERMMLDIDFLVQNDEISQAAEALRAIGYNTYTGTMYWDKSTKHYPRLTNPNRISDIEMHFNPASEEACVDYGYSHIRKDGMVRDTYILPSIKDDLKINFLHAMFDNKGYWLKKSALREMYDAILFIRSDSFSEISLNQNQTRIYTIYLSLISAVCGLSLLPKTESFFLQKRHIYFHNFRLNNPYIQWLEKRIDEAVLLSGRILK